jgi:hypothetical protein
LKQFTRDRNDKGKKVAWKNQKSTEAIFSDYNHYSKKNSFRSDKPNIILK